MSMRACYLFQLSFVAAISLLAANSAFAANPYKTPCTADGKRICSTQDVAKAESCLRQHMSELTPACKAYLTKKKG